MDTEQLNIEEYVAGFNNAVLLAEYEPEFLEEVVPSLNPSNNYFEGFFAGKSIGIRSRHRNNNWMSYRISESIKR